MAYSDRGAAKLYLKDYEGGAADFYQALKINPKAKGMYSNIGTMFSQQNNFKKAVEFYELGLKEFPNDKAQGQSFRSLITPFSS